MKKSLIALAVLAASGVASAQSTVTIYGLLDTYLGQTKTTVGGAGVSQTVINSGGLQTSRFGLKGTEDLGGGLAANFVLESGFNLDTGAATGYTNPYTGATTASVFSRNSWVGLSGGFGQVKIGKMWTAFDDVKGSGAAAFDANIFAPATFVWGSNNYQDRPGNAIYYSTPSFGGFSGTAMYSFGENKTAATSAGKITSFNLQYGAGPFAAALSYQTEKANGGVTATKFTQLNGSWDFGVVKALAAYGRVKDGTSPISGVAISKTNEYQLGLDFPVNGVFTLSGGYAWSKDKQPAGPDIKRKGFGIAGLYALSKRTNFYAGINQSKQDQFGATAEVKNHVYAAGIRHTF